MNPKILPALAALFAVSLAGCNEVAYVRHQDRLAVTAGDPEEGFGRKVDYHLGSAFYMTPPACVMIVPITGKDLTPEVKRAVEDTVGRHLTTRFDRIIDARRVVGEARRRVFDPVNADDRKRLARALRCDSFAEIDSAGVGSIFAIVWTEISVNIAITLKRSRDGEVLWRGRHRARRGDGGMPLSIFGVGGGALAAGKLANDTDALPSIIDDSVRRMMASLPDIRKF